MSESASTYPPGYLQQYSGNRLLAVSIVFIILDTIFVALRLYTRRAANNSKWGFDDDFLMPALIMNLGMCSLGIGAYASNFPGQGAELQQSWSKLLAWATISLQSLLQR